MPPPPFLSLLRSRRPLIGMVHLQALPGAPRARLAVADIARRAAAEARLLARAGFDAVMIENMHDAPYASAPHGPEVVATMTAAGLAVRDAVACPIGVQVLSGGAREALAVALAIGGEFVRVENFVFAHVADEGLMPDAAAGPLLRYRRAIGADHVAVLADVKKKHASHAITADLSIADAAHAAEFFGADAVIVTGPFTARPADPADLAAARRATRLPVLVGSGVTAASARALRRAADGLIVGSAVKRAGRWANPVDPRRAAALVRAARR
jgi:membrane complex biogenesis BtpA family protein